MKIENEILVSRQAWLIEKIEKINKKAKKLGFAPFVLTFANERLITKLHPVSSLVIDSYAVITATIEGETPKIAGWELFSIFENINGVIFTRTVPGKELTYNPTEIKCEHCGINRRRNKSFYLQNETTKEFKEIGSTCVKDFIGHDPKGFLVMAGFNFEDIMKEANEYSGSERFEGYNLEEYLAMTKAIINVRGWISAAGRDRMYEKGIENVVTTASDVVDQFFARMRPALFPKNFEYIYSNEQDLEFAKKAIEFFTNKTETNDYINNVKKILQMGYVPSRKEGLAASIVGSYYMHVQKELQTKTEKQESNHIGTIKERIKGMKLVYVGRNGFDSEFGYTFIHTLKDAAGNVFKWFSTNDIDADFGTEITLDGTVKKHDEYKGLKQTILTRCTIK
jgi:hypothetical protein